MQRLEVSGVVRPIYGSLGVKRLSWAHRLSAHSQHQTSSHFVYQFPIWNIWTGKQELKNYFNSVLVYDAVKFGWNWLQFRRNVRHLSMVQRLLDHTEMLRMTCRIRTLASHCHGGDQLLGLTLVRRSGGASSIAGHRRSSDSVTGSELCCLTYSTTVLCQPMAHNACHMSQLYCLTSYSKLYCANQQTHTPCHMSQLLCQPTGTHPTSQPNYWHPFFTISQSQPADCYLRTFSHFHKSPHVHSRRVSYGRPSVLPSWSLLVHHLQSLYSRGSQSVLRGALRAPRALPRGSAAAPGK